MGSILANIQLLKGDKISIPRTVGRNHDYVPVRLFAFIYAAYELDPENSDSGILARVEVSFSNLGPKFESDGAGGYLNDDFASTAKAATRNPIFGDNCSGFFCFGKTEVLGSIELAPNFRIDVRNMTKGGFFNKPYIIGSTSVHPSDPTYVHHIRDDNQLDNLPKPSFFTLKKDGK